jgi:hypothetical protein
MLKISLILATIGIEDAAQYSMHCGNESLRSQGEFFEAAFGT